MDFSQRSDRVLWMRLSIIGGLLAVAGVIVFAVFHSASVSSEAVVYEEIVRQLVANTTEGRQAVVSSVWWPPLAALVRLPLVLLFPDDGFPWSSICVGALCGFFVLSFLWRCSINLAGWLRSVVICLMLACAPFFLKELTNGSTMLLVALLTVVGADSMARWLVGRSVRAIVYFAACSALICGLSPELTVWVGMMLLLFIVDLLRSRSMSRSQKGAALILGLMPTAYLIALWVLMNWLIMGDALYFLRSLWAASALPTVAGEGTADLGVLHVACGLIPAFTAGVAAGCRNRTGMLWSLFALFLFLSAIIFRQLGMLWADTHILGLLPLFVFFTAVMSMGHVGGGEVAGWRGALILLPVLVLILSYAGLSSDKDEAAPEVQLAIVERHAMARSRYAKVFVCGYDSFPLLKGNRSKVFQHALDFNFNKAKDDYRGHDLFVMVKKPAGRGRGDSIHWKYADIYSLGSEETLYDADWGDWRMFQVIQPPKEGK